MLFRHLRLHGIKIETSTLSASEGMIEKTSGITAGQLDFLLKIAHTSGAGIGPKNIRSAFSLPITRTNSCTVQYMAMSTNKTI